MAFKWWRLEYCWAGSAWLPATQLPSMFVIPIVRRVKALMRNTIESGREANGTLLPVWTSSTADYWMRSVSHSLGSPNLRWLCFCLHKRCLGNFKQNIQSHLNKLLWYFCISGVTIWDSRPSNPLVSSPLYTTFRYDTRGAGTIGTFIKMNLQIVMNTLERYETNKS